MTLQGPETCEFYGNNFKLNKQYMYVPINFNFTAFFLQIKTSASKFEPYLHLIPIYRTFDLKMPNHNKSKHRAFNLNSSFLMFCFIFTFRFKTE